MKIFTRVGLFLLFLSASLLPAGAVQHNKRRKLSRRASKGTQKTGDATEDAKNFEEEVRRDEVSFFSFSSPKKKKNQDTRCRTSPRLSKLANSSPPVDEQKKRDVDEQEPMCPADSPPGSKCKKDMCRAAIVPPLRICLLLLH
jgi:hypothetical protein